MSFRDQRAERDRAVGSQGDADRRMLLTGATIVTMGPAGVVRGDILLRSSTIEAIGPGLADQVGEEAIVIDASGTIIVPGLIDSHLHAWEGQLRGVAPDADFGEYMSITHGGLALHYRPEDLAIAERLSAAQAINAGTTTFIDNSHNSRSRGHSDAAIEALLSTGIRAVYAAGSAQVGDHEAQLPTDLLRLREEYFSSGQDLVTLRMFDVMPSIEQWRFADEHGFDLCAEMGFWVPDVEKLGESGLMRPGHTYNHCSGFSDAMWGAIADSGAAVNLVQVRLAVRARRVLPRASGRPARHSDRHQLRQ